MLGIHTTTGLVKRQIRRVRIIRAAQLLPDIGDALVYEAPSGRCYDAVVTAPWEGEPAVQFFAGEMHVFVTTAFVVPGEETIYTTGWVTMGQVI